MLRDPRTVEECLAPNRHWDEWIAARQTGRPVHWIPSRSETFLTDNQARDTVTEAALALDAEGRFLGLRIAGMANMGAYLTSHAAFISTVNFTRCLPGMYHIPRLSVRIQCLFSNTVPTGPYRGAEHFVDDEPQGGGPTACSSARRSPLPTSAHSTPNTPLSPAPKRREK